MPIALSQRIGHFGPGAVALRAFAPMQGSERPTRRRA